MNHGIYVRHLFYKELYKNLRIIWPVFSLLMVILICLGFYISYLEGWESFEGVYFAFVTALTVGYGDFVPKHPFARFIAIIISFTGILLTALFAAISVRALETAVLANKPSPPDQH